MKALGLADGWLTPTKLNSLGLAALMYDPSATLARILYESQWRRVVHTRPVRALSLEILSGSCS